MNDVGTTDGPADFGVEQLPGFVERDVRIDMAKDDGQTIGAKGAACTEADGGACAEVRAVGIGESGPVQAHSDWLTQPGAPMKNLAPRGRAIRCGASRTARASPDPACCR